jgi:chromosome segregation ATPase
MAMTVESDGAQKEPLRSPARADFYRYEEPRREGGESRSWVAIDKTTAMIVGAIASASLAIAIAGGTALVQKVDETAKDVERGRAERIADFGEVSKNISIVETKLNQLITQLTQLELRIERSISNDLATRDKKIEQMEKQFNELRDNMNEIDREKRRQR